MASCELSDSVSECVCESRPRLSVGLMGRGEKVPWLQGPSCTGSPKSKTPRPSKAVASVACSLCCCCRLGPARLRGETPELSVGDTGLSESAALAASAREPYDAAVWLCRSPLGWTGACWWGTVPGVVAREVGLGRDIVSAVWDSGGGRTSRNRIAFRLDEPLIDGCLGIAYEESGTITPLSPSCQDELRTPNPGCRAEVGVFSSPQNPGHAWGSLWRNGCEERFRLLRLFLLLELLLLLLLLLESMFEQSNESSRNTGKKWLRQRRLERLEGWATANH